MQSFLKCTRKLVNSPQSICIVLGNESCDLDSAVSAVTLAFYYHQKAADCNMSYHTSNFLPVLNIPRRDYPLKTEVNFVFNQYGINEESLTFRDELQPDFLSRSKFILVDHHVSPFASHCIEVFDHRTFDETAQLPSNCAVHMEIVGSCSTLIAEMIVRELEKTIPRTEEHGVMLSLLRSAIILDTINFAAAAGRYTPKDEEMCGRLEKLLATFPNTICGRGRTELFESMRKARGNITNLTSLQLLRKDLKVLSNNDDSLKIAIPGFPLLVQQFITRPDAVAAIEEFVKDTNIVIVVLMGMLVEGNSVQRDLGFVNIRNKKLYSALQQKLLTFSQPSFDLQLYEDCNFMKGTFYKMLNIKATRKHILPLIKVVLDEWHNSE